MTDITSYRSPASAAPRRLPALGQVFAALSSLHRSRRDLARLDARLLEDIGVSRRAAETEAGRPLWDVPAHWLE